MKDLEQRLDNFKEKAKKLGKDYFNVHNNIVKKEIENPQIPLVVFPLISGEFLLYFGGATFLSQSYPIGLTVGASVGVGRGIQSYLYYKKLKREKYS